MNILLANDDGIQAVGLRALHRALVEAGHSVHVVAPVTEQSAVGHAVTLSMPVRVREFREDGFYGQGVYGTPVDCVKLGLSTLLDEKPDLVLSGINAGANVGVDILYSGTVSAATEGALMEIPSMAVSMDNFNPVDLSGQARYTADLLPPHPLGGAAAQVRAQPQFPRLPRGRGAGACRMPAHQGLLHGLVRHPAGPARQGVLLAGRDHPPGADQPRPGQGAADAEARHPDAVAFRFHAQGGNDAVGQGIVLNLLTHYNCNRIIIGIVYYMERNSILRRN